MKQLFSHFHRNKQSQSATSSNETKKFQLRFGMRTAKTALSVIICIIVSYFLHRPSPALMALSAIFTLREDTKESLVFTRIRLISTFLGGIISIVYVLLFPVFPSAIMAQLFLLPLGIVFIIMFCDTMNQNMSIFGATATFLVIVAATPELTLSLVLQRIIDTLIGAAISLGVNHFINPQNTQQS